ncbi:MAG: PilZ domain-containing protein [Novosphingobium sp.]
MTEPVRTPRQSIRYPVWLTATCRTSLGRVSDVILSNLSEHGCGMTGGDDLLKPGQLVVIRLLSLEGLPGQVCWVRGKRAGVQFDRPLYGPVVEHIVNVQLSAPPAEREPRRGGIGRV